MFLHSTGGLRFTKGSILCDFAESFLIGVGTLFAGHYEEKFLNEKFGMDGCEDVFEEEPDILPGRKKRKRPPMGECDEFNRELCSLLESSSKILTAHMDSQNLNFHLDRTQRKEHAESLVLVLGKLADAVGKIADKL